MSLVQDMLKQQHEKHADQFVGFWGRLLLWLAPHRKQAFAVLMIVAAVVAVWFGGSAYWQAQQIKSSEQYYLISQEADEAKRMQALQDFVAKYERQPAGKFALFELAKLQQKNNAAEAGVASLEKLVSISQSQPILNIAARFELGRQYQASSKTDAALKIFENLSQEKSNPLHLEAAYQAALCYEQLQQFDKAKAEYEKIIADSSAQEAIIKQKSEDRLLELRLQG